MAIPRLILASGSKARATLLKNTGLVFEAIPAKIDEAAIIKTLEDQGQSFEAISLHLAKEKALRLSEENPINMIIGADQILVCDGVLYQKAETYEDAKQKLQSLRGKTHQLITSACAVKAGQSLWQYTDTAYLTMRGFNDSFLNGYMQEAGSDLTDCVGGYAIEGRGAWLFDKVNGDYFTIMGLPLLQFLKFLSDHGFEL